MSEPTPVIQRVDPVPVVVSQGIPGPAGPPGPGVPAGGAAGQVLRKNTATDYDLSWGAASSGSGVTEFESTATYPVGAFVTYKSQAWENTSAGPLTGVAPPGSGSGEGVLGAVAITPAATAADAGIAASTHGARFVPNADVAVTKVAFTLFGTTTAAETVAVWLRPSAGPAPILGTDTPDGTLAVASGVTGKITIPLTAQKTILGDVSYTAWLSNSAIPIGSTPDLIGVSDTAPTVTGGITTPAVQYVTGSPGGGAKTDQTGLYVAVEVTVASGQPWTRRIPGDLSRASADAFYATAGHNHDAAYAALDERIDARTLNTATLSITLAGARRWDLTTTATACQITLPNPSPLPAASTAVRRRTIVLRTPSTVATPGAVTWVNLTGASSIGTPTTGQLVMFDVEWVDTTAGWCVVGVKA